MLCEYSFNRFWIKDVIEFEELELLFKLTGNFGNEVAFEFFNKFNIETGEPFDDVCKFLFESSTFPTTILITWLVNSLTGYPAG